MTPGQRAAIESLDDQFGRLHSQWVALIDQLRDAAPCPAWCQDHELSKGDYEQPNLHDRATVGVYDTVGYGGCDIDIVATDDLRTGERDGPHIVVADQELTPEQARRLAQLLRGAARTLEP
jgi:hypothetical protein